MQDYLKEFRGCLGLPCWDPTLLQMECKILTFHSGRNGFGMTGNGASSSFQEHAAEIPGHGRERLASGLLVLCGSPEQPAGSYQVHICTRII